MPYYSCNILSICKMYSVSSYHCLVQIEANFQQVLYQIFDNCWFRYFDFGKNFRLLAKFIFLVKIDRNFHQKVQIWSTTEKFCQNQKLSNIWQRSSWKLASWATYWHFRACPIIARPTVCIPNCYYKSLVSKFHQIYIPTLLHMHLQTQQSLTWIGISA